MTMATLSILKKWAAGILLILAALFFSCNGNEKRSYTVGILNIVPALEPTVRGFKNGMAELGYTEGENIRYIHEGIAWISNNWTDMRPTWFRPASI